jgi:hypothetical protein
MPIWNSSQTFFDILWPFGTFCVHLVHFLLVWVILHKKNLATLNAEGICKYFPLFDKKAEICKV